MSKTIRGSKGVGSYSSAIEARLFPSESSIEHEGIIYDYQFETGSESEKLFKPVYSIARTKDPLSELPEYYICVGLNSKLDGEGFYKHGGRPPLNLVIVLDISDSMRSPFSYNESKSKLDCAKETLLDLVKHLTENDYFGLCIFNTIASVIIEVTLWKNIDKNDFINKVNRITTEGGTDLSVGIELASKMLTQAKMNSTNGNRIMYLTDMQVNSGNTDSASLTKLTQENAANGIYTTFLGIGAEFDTAMVSKISNTKACNYFTVKNAQQFKKLMDEEFDFTVTPTLFDTSVNFVGEQVSEFEAQRVYGSPGFEIPLNGVLFFTDSMFPSHKESEEKTKGGVVLVKLNKKPNSQGSAKILKFLATYQDMNGKIEKDEDIVDVTALTEESNNDYFQNNCIRKTVLLVRYVNFMKNFLRDIRTHASEPSMNQNTGIIIPSIEGESKSSAGKMTPLSTPYVATFKKFISHFEREMTEIGDPLLNTELKKLIAIMEYK